MAFKSKKLVAAVWIEYPGGNIRRIRPGDEIPGDFPKDSIPELRKHKAIVAAGEPTEADRNIVVRDSGTGA
jgi:hypothetical protein